MDVCSRCGKSRESGTSGSLTQWMAACTCDIQTVLDEQAESLHICQTCGKRINSGRAGSMTQWVFRQELCNCSSPASRRPRPSSEQLARQLHSPGSEEEEEKEIELGGAPFPYSRYSPLAKLGSGAYGEVYLCRDRLLGKKVAVKTLRQLTPEQLVSFQMEAKATSALNHPNIVTVLDFGATESGAPFMVLEFVKGESLDDSLARLRTLPWKTALLLISQLANALSYAHDMSIFHRDLNPKNILVVDGNLDQVAVRLIDFGVAKVKEAQEPTIVQGRTLVGTPAYMSPDQLYGLDYDRRSEVYSLGCVLFQCLTGQVPFQGDTVIETLTMHANENPPRLADFAEAESVPSALQGVLDRCLKKNPDERFQSMEELSSSISGLIEEHGDKSGKGTPTAPATTAQYEKRIILKNVSTLLLVSGALAVGLWLLRVNQQPANSPKKSASVRSNFKITKEVDGKLVGAIWTVPKNQIVDEDLKELSKKTVFNLNLSRQQIDGSGLRYLKPDVEYLNLESTTVRDENFQYINRLTGLRGLVLNNTSVSIAGLQQLTDLKDLIAINLTYCPQIDDAAVKLIVQRWPKLRKLQMGDTKCSGAILPVVGTLKELVEFEGGGLAATPEQWSSIMHKDVRELNFAASNISEKNIPGICKLKSLRRLSLEGCRNVKEGDIQKLEAALPGCVIMRSTLEKTEKFEQYTDLFDTLGETKQCRDSKPE